MAARSAVFGHLQRTDPREGGQGRGQCSGVFLAAGEDLRETPELRPHQRCHHFVASIHGAHANRFLHPIAIQRTLRVVAAGVRQGERLAEAAGILRRLGQCPVVGHEQTAFPSCQALAGLKRKGTGCSQGPDRPASIGRAMSLGRVLEQPQPMAASDGADGVQVRGAAVDVDRHHGSRPRRDLRREPRGIEAAGLGIDIHEDRHRPLEDHGQGRGDKGVGRDDHLVSFPDAKGGQGKLKRAGAAVGEQAERRAAEFPELALQRPRLGRVHP